jgi:L-alanine-DL-glutamate epimerase-like enolase superfamily enzyme
MLQQGVYDILQPETMAAEGITGMRKIGTLAQAFGRQITPHCALADLGTVAALHLVAALTGPDSKSFTIRRYVPIATGSRFSGIRLEWMSGDKWPCRRDLVWVSRSIQT